MYYKFLSCQQNAEENHDIKIGNDFFESVGKVTIFGDNYENLNSVHEGNEDRVNSGNVSEATMKDLQSSQFVAKKCED